ncbi:MAG: ABC transporter ATP-binding protein [Burkholderiales bacterium]|nr:ABC transporter ATP-binding protein [Burkholderiales bacterium]
MVALEIQGVTKTFGSLTSLDHVTFQVHEGEFFGLLGPNGAGKTTLISIVAGLARATSGRVCVMGHDTVRDAGKARSNLGVVPQELVFDPFFTVRETLQFQSGYFGLSKNDTWIEELLHELSLTDKADVNMRALSGGMKRRVLVAQALVHKPPVIILDEPTAGVDVELRKILWSFVSRLNKEGHAVVLTTHYLEEAEALCDRIAILRTGKLIKLDTKSNLLAAHARQIVAIRLSVPVPADFKPLGRQYSDNACELLVALDRLEQLEPLLASVRERGLQMLDFDLRKPDLEDVFVNIIKDGVAT